MSPGEGRTDSQINWASQMLGHAVKMNSTREKVYLDKNCGIGRRSTVRVHLVVKHQITRRAGISRTELTTKVPMAACLSQTCSGHDGACRSQDLSLASPKQRKL